MKKHKIPKGELTLKELIKYLEILQVLVGELEFKIIKLQDIHTIAYRSKN